MTIFFEKYSLLQVLLLAGQIRKASHIWFNERAVQPLPGNKSIKKIVVNLISKINPQAVIGFPPMQLINRLTWQVNRAAVDFLEKIIPEVRKQNSLRTVLQVINDKNILKAYKSHLVHNVVAANLFYLVAEELSSESETILIIPGNNYSIYLFDEVRDINAKLILPGIVRIINAIRYVFCKMAAVMKFVLMPAYFVIVKERLRIGKVNCPQGDIATQVVWGTLGAGQIGSSGIKTPQDDGYLYSDRLKAGQLVHIFGNWRFDRQREEALKRAMRTRNIPFADQHDYKMNWKFLKKAAFIQLLLMVKGLRYLGFWQDSPEVLMAGANIIRGWLWKLMELENVRFKVEFNRSDYSADHIIETIACNQNGRITVGIQHNGAPEVLPQMCYVHYNKYIVYGPAFVGYFEKYWRGLELEKNGRENIDWIITIINDKDKLTAIKEKISSLYGRRQLTAVITLPSDADYNLAEQWQEIYEGLKELHKIPLDCHIFLRFRQPPQLAKKKYIRQFVDLPAKDPRIIIDLTNFTTQELMAACDLFISNSSSFGIYEALAAGVKSFTFEVRDVSEYFFPDCGQDFILHTRQDLIKVFKGLTSNFAGFDCNWDYIKDRGNYHYDGRNLERIRQTLAAAVAAAELNDQEVREMSSRCPICNSTDTQKIRDKEGIRSGVKSSY